MELARRIAVALAACAPLSATAAVDCRDPAAECTLREAAAQAGIRVGAAARPGPIASDPLYGPTLGAEYDSLTPENDMKWRAIHPEPDRYDFTAADALVAFAEANGMTVRGHTLVWDQRTVDGTPDYVTTITDPEELRALLADHIATVVGRYRGKVDAWDVVNEPFEQAGDTLYPNVFLERLGSDYIAEAFELAHAADPDAKLFLNEVLIPFVDSKFEALLALAADLLERGVPIHGIGIQGHYVFPGISDGELLRQRLQAFVDLGLTVEITELDIARRTDLDRETSLALQAAEYSDVVRACLAVSQCARITTWGFTDRYTWFDSFFSPDLDPLPLDEDYARKPAWYAMRDALAAPEPGGEGLLAALATLAALASRRARRKREGPFSRCGGEPIPRTCASAWPSRSSPRGSPWDASPSTRSTRG
jgi:endo-1,4-beta-xylanase